MSSTKVTIEKNIFKVYLFDDNGRKLDKDGKALLNENESRPVVGMGIRKASAINDHMDEFKEFVKENS